jgi:hypothetical protein
VECAVQSSGEPRPVTDSNGPYYHQVAVATTRDGATISDPVEVLQHASVPDGVRLPDGTVGIYYVNGEDGSIWLARLSGGSARPVAPITLDGVSRPAGIVDPDATLVGGRVRLVYLSGFGAPGALTRRTMCVAESADGLRFDVRGPAITFLTSQSETDPSVVELGDGSWLMAISRGQRTLLARSGDGLAFTAGEELSYGGVPELALAADGRVRLYVCARGIESYLSADGGRSWHREGVVVPPGTLGRNLVCDPSRVAGTDLFVFKVAN